MARINLLPWREELRRERQRQFLLSTVMTAVLGLILVFVILMAFNQRISHQEMRNDTIRAEIATLNVAIAKIERLEETRERLLSRKRIIENLQASRSLTVEMLDQMAKSIPVGITLSSVRQQGMNVSFSGFSQSNARVSAYLQSLERNDLFRDPDLGVVKTANQPMSSVEPYEFAIRSKLKPRVEEDDGYDETEEGEAE